MPAIRAHKPRPRGKRAILFVVLLLLLSPNGDILLGSTPYSLRGLVFV